MRGKRGLPHFLTRFLLREFFRIGLEVEGEIGEDVVICRYRDDRRGAFCFSVDFDLLVGDMSSIFHLGTRGILQVADCYGIPISWGICGRYAKENFEVFKEVVGSRVHHDVGIHTYGHIDLSSQLPRSTIVNDINEAIRTVQEVETDNSSDRPTSFIFPFNRIGQLDVLKELRFTSYRGGGASAKIAPPVYDEGLWNIYQTYYLRSGLDVLPTVERLIDLSISYGGVFHIWTHPWNMHSNGDVKEFIDRVISPLFRYVAELRDDGVLWTCTMRELAAYSEARRNCKIEDFVESGRDISFKIQFSPLDSRFSGSPRISLKIPFGSHEVSYLLVDGREADRSSWQMKKKGGINYLILSIPFSEGCKKIQITKDFLS